MSDGALQLWRIYAKEDVRLDGERFRDAANAWLFLYEHPVTSQLGGVREPELDTVRQSFAAWLRERLWQDLAAPYSRPEKLEKSAQLLYRLLRQSPAPHDWLRLPADTRPERNRSTLAYHALLVSAFACAMARAWVAHGRPIGELLRFQAPVGEPEQAVTLEEWIHFVRVASLCVASLCHDFGKHPPQRHHERGREQVRELFSGLMDELVVFSLSEVAYRHHTARACRERSETPIGPLEELIAHADTLASAADRPAPGDGQSASEQQDPVQSVSRFLRDELGAEDALSLIAADTDRVKSYVFESARLPEVRGASALLTHLNESEISTVLWRDFRLPPECLLYAAGGSVLIVAPTALAKPIAESIEQLYLQQTRMATISAVYRPTRPREWVRGVGGSEGRFGDLVEWLGYDLRRAKESRAFYPFFYAPPHAKRCDSCEVRPAEHKERDPDGRDTFLCRACQRKRDFGRDRKSAYISQFEDFLRREGEATAYGRHFNRLRPDHTVHGAQNLDDIGKGAEARARGYVGVIYTDGNDIGKRIQGSQTPAEYRTLSEELLRATKQATFRALAERSLLKEIQTANGENQWRHCFEIIAIGGDDVFLIVPGDVALDIVVALCAEFEREFDGRLTMSAGVLIMRDHFPIYHARNIVESLLKSAKKAGRRALQQDGAIPAHVEFQVITGDSSLSEDLEAYRKEVYGDKPRFERYRLSERPYRLDALRRLLQAGRWARRHLPASQLYQLQQAVVEHTPMWTQLWYRYQLARAKDSKQEATLLKFHQWLFNSDPWSDTDAPWRREDGQWTTPIVDLAEIFDYLRVQEGEDSREAGN
jgi:hypothetical protein